MAELRDWTKEDISYEFYGEPGWVDGEEAEICEALIGLVPVDVAIRVLKATRRWCSDEARNACMD